MVSFRFCLFCLIIFSNTFITCFESNSNECFKKYCNEKIICECQGNTFKCPPQTYCNNKYSSDENFMINKPNFVLINGDFGSNCITSLKKHELFPGRESTLERLNFYDNKIKFIENGVFDKFIALKELILRKNFLSEVGENVFTKSFSQNFIGLDLSQNRINWLPATAFKNLEKLQLLDLSQNYELKFSIRFKFPDSLKFLDLSHCGLSELNDTFFGNLKNLQNLNLNENLFLSIPKAIKALSNLQIFKMQSNQIKAIQDCDFCGLKNLRSLNFNDNQNLSFIHENAFGYLETKHFLKIEFLSLSRCNLSILPKNLLDWKNVKSIYFDVDNFNCNCSMTWLIKDVKTPNSEIANNFKIDFGIGAKHFLFCANLNLLMKKIPNNFCNETFVDINDNLLSACGDEWQEANCECKNQKIKCKEGPEIPNIIIRDPKIIIKNASFVGCELKKLEKGKLLPFREHTIENLDFFYNAIKFIENQTFDKFSSLKFLNLGRNSLTNISDGVFTPQLGSSLLELNLWYNKKLNFSLVYFKHLRKLETLNMGFCGLTDLPENIFENLSSLKSLYLKNNPFTSIPTSLKHLPNLRYLNFAEANLKSLNSDVFQFNLKLTSVFFDECRSLKIVDENTFGCANPNSTCLDVKNISFQKCLISTLPEKLLNWKTVTSISIYKNPWNCDCQMKWLIDDFKRSSPIYKHKLIFHEGPGTLSCYSPVELWDTWFFSVPPMNCSS